MAQFPPILLSKLSTTPGILAFMVCFPKEEHKLEGDAEWYPILSDATKLAIASDLGDRKELLIYIRDYNVLVMKLEWVRIQQGQSMHTPIFVATVIPRGHKVGKSLHRLILRAIIDRKIPSPPQKKPAAAPKPSLETPKSDEFSRYF